MRRRPSCFARRKQTPRAFAHRGWFICSCTEACRATHSSAPRVVRGSAYASACWLSTIKRARDVGGGSRGDQGIDAGGGRMGRQAGRQQNAAEGQQKGWRKGR
eukprot:5685824-Pleurochrysis_carterae.AAC.8